MSENEKFKERFELFFQACKVRVLNHYKDSISDYSFHYQDGKKYIKLYYKWAYKDGSNGQSCGFCIVNKENGDVLKMATYDRPAKGARGNIFDEWNGMKRITVYGPEYNNSR